MIALQLTRKQCLQERTGEADCRKGGDDGQPRYDYDRR